MTLCVYKNNKIFIPSRPRDGNLDFIREVLSSYLGRNTDYSDAFRGFPRPLQANSEIVTRIGPRPLPSKSFSTRRSFQYPTLYMAVFLFVLCPSSVYFSVDLFKQSALSVNS
jgi:hypothetical protein